MDCLLVSGYPRTGKNFTTVRIAHFLSENDYLYADGDAIPLRGSGDNFTTVLRHPNSQKRVLLNTKSDYEENADQLIDFYRGHEPIDVLITTIRDAGPPRDSMDSAVRHLQPLNIVEIPLARITGQRQDWQQAVNAYLDRVEDLARFVLQALPFQVQNP